MEEIEIKEAIEKRLVNAENRYNKQQAFLSSLLGKEAPSGIDYNEEYVLSRTLESNIKLLKDLLEA